MARAIATCAVLFCVMFGFAACGSESASSNGIEDGTYQVDVTLTGGSGRADVESPATVEVEDGSMTATVV